MKVSNNPDPSKGEVSQTTLNKWQREDTAKKAKVETNHTNSDPKDAGKPAEG